MPRAKGEEPTRRCAITGKEAPKSQLIRFVISADMEILPDYEAKLEGRGLWTVLDRTVLDKAQKTGALKKAAGYAFKTKPNGIKIGANLTAKIDAYLMSKCLHILGLERRSGHLVLGAEKLKAACLKGHAKLVVVADDVAVDTLRKLKSAATKGDVIITQFCSRDELSLAVGQENVVQAALTTPHAAKNLKAALMRLEKYRNCIVTPLGPQMQEYEEDRR